MGLLERSKTRNKKTMKPEDKAYSIYDDYYACIYHYGSDLSPEITREDLAKKCSIIALKRIIYNLDKNNYKEYKYWEDVKQIIEKL